MSPDNLTQLGQSSRPAASPEQAVLETVPYHRPDGPPTIVRFTAPEFTSLCPVTGQPDFAHIVIDYAPDRRLVESKSLKLFLTSFRNHGAFHEDCTVAIARRIVAATAPLWLRIGGYWYPRGGIPIDVFWQTGPAPEGVFLPDQGVPPYRGRG
ncbi:preQ(1) synthase [Jiella sonneratiae]|uniref:NADPH-dependent 7-cyano-7-deazaguanine reductase n=1 Tax=Jiella sonneratiae TaxID=2816856 RepID=A0ABS3J186_9HYPH|nr:preQ(1) synthase [Jiella sonneratiae]MBO0903449.1 NADPH-dependent 7-cyano-7-deazaguanine reductase QueF [Jiella sonneratiae]